jgi:hypothetical protein
MRDLVRVKDPETGHEFTVTRARAEKAGLRVLDKDAVDAFGAPLAAKHNITPRKATKADNKKES